MIAKIAVGIPLFLSFLTHATPSPPSDYDLIRNTLAHYPLSIDLKNFSGLSGVFTENAIADYGPPLNTLSGLEAIAAGIEKACVVNHYLLEST